MDTAAVEDQTRAWISSVVIGLNLCPFARRVFDAGLIRYVISDVEQTNDLLQVLSTELLALAGTPAEEIETTLLIHPLALRDFLDFNEFLETADRQIRDLGLEGVIQLASFHPEYRFAGADIDAVENFTNRSPYPMLHLLREDSISSVAADPTRLLRIPRDNEETLRRVGRERMLATISKIKEPH